MNGLPLDRLAALNPIPDPEAAVHPPVRDAALARITATPDIVLPARRHRNRRRLIASVTMTAAAAVGVLSVLPTDPRGGLPAAAQALADQTTGQVVHTIQAGSTTPDATGGPAAVQTETWQLRDGSQVRTKITYPDGTFQDMVTHREAHRYRVDAYFSKSKTLDRGTWQEISSHSPAPRPDPAASLSRDVQDGNVKVLGETTVNGIAAYRLAPTGGDPISRHVTWTISKDADHPQLLAQSICLPSSPCIATDFSIYETTSDTTTAALPDYPS